MAGQVVFLLNGVLGNFHSNILPITPLPSSSERQEPLGAFFNQALAEVVALAWAPTTQGNEEWILWLVLVEIIAQRFIKEYWLDILILSKDLTGRILREYT